VSKDKITPDDANAFAEAVAQYITDRNPKLPGCLERVLNRWPTAEFRERRHARIMRVAADAMGLGSLADERVMAYQADGAAQDVANGAAPDGETLVCRETSGLDSAVRRGLASMEDLDKIEALGKALVAVARAARGAT